MTARTIKSENSMDTPPDTLRSKQSLRLWLKLLGRTNLIEKTLQGHLRDAYQTTLPRFDVLAELYRRPDGVTMGDLSAMLMVSNGNVTGLARRLQEDGLLIRTPKPSDKRTILLRITDAGKSAFEEMATAHEQWVSTIFASLSAQDITTLMALLDKINSDSPASGKEETHV
ncbi:transcriptional regulator [Kordiimonas sediminis]|uniref:Transcriptional regulator n=1 Tax=Kordiimonas sediminis TaxID=1735581 RepID=A0A919E4R8_9PROT|nr:MarR family transcriptional regulator [Kordiimonas sediminis]GHF13521.1 transcriptional regulator [Kordiimonas sediminis]